MQPDTAITSPTSIICDQAKMDSVALVFSKTLKAGDVITLSGDLGAGKTTFATMLCKHLLINDLVTSPTYTYLNIYDDKVAHFDLYRLKHPNEFFSMGFEEYLDSDYITIIEWSEVIDSHLPETTKRICLNHKDHRREVKANVPILL